MRSPRGSCDSKYDRCLLMTKTAPEPCLSFAAFAGSLFPCHNHDAALEQPIAVKWVAHYERMQAVALVALHYCLRQYSCRSVCVHHTSASTPSHQIPNRGSLCDGRATQGSRCHIHSGIIDAWLYESAKKTPTEMCHGSSRGICFSKHGGSCSALSEKNISTDRRVKERMFDTPVSNFSLLRHSTK